MLAPLDNETIFKKAFTDKDVFVQFVKDILDIDFKVGKIETEKKFVVPVGLIDIKFDIFAESTDNRIIVEIQRMDYDYNFDRFLDYFLAAIIELQKNYKSYKIEKTVYTIVLITAPYIINKQGLPVKDDVLITELNPKNLKGQMRDLFGHKLVFLNPNYQDPETPPSIKDWLQLIHQSIHNPEHPDININKTAIKKVAEIIDEAQITPEERNNAKIDESRRIAKEIYIKFAKRERDVEIAKGLKADGIPINIIAKNTVLTIDEIEDL
ncbi:PD-(D/E)XK nuclease family transposase [Candidatus Poribacteria bacterium]|nr:PD-(D/E)XK nuclease family transposase [Candidatus Poribacteria bacterium]